MHLFLKKIYRKNPFPKIYRINQCEVLKSDSDLKDLQKIGNIIYDFRCECTHSNRSYPIQRNINKSEESLNLYIILILDFGRKVAKKK